jgi:hypothetical protein
MLRRGLLAVVLFAGCGSDSNNNMIDAPGSGSGTDAAPSTVMVVDCATATPTLTVTHPTFAYTNTPADPNSSTDCGSSACEGDIAVGDVVKFDLHPNQFHPVGPDAASGMTDPNIKVTDDTTVCLKFTAAGSFHYRCTIHGFKGIVKVQ